MNDIQRRFAFLIGCIGTRTLFVFLAKFYPTPLYAIPALIMGLAFIVLYLGHYRQTGFEATGGVIWWNNVRPIHGLLYLIFAYLIYYQYSFAWIVLLIDVIFGLLNYLMHQ
jgi:hypothetical protein